MGLFLGLILGRWWRLDQICESCSQNSQHLPLHVPDRDDAIIITIVFGLKKIILAECAKKGQVACFKLWPKFFVCNYGAQRNKSETKQISQ